MSAPAPAPLFPLDAALRTWDGVFRQKAAELYPPQDPSHDLLHVCRVVAMALRLAAAEGADPFVVLPAAYFHDFVTVPKDDPRRARASQLSAAAATEYLSSAGYPARHLPAIAHAIAAHSFSAGIAPQTLEAKVVQDADRLDALGAIGIARCFSTGALLRRPYYDPADPWAERRAPDDRAFAIDHFPVKLFKIAETLWTPAAQRLGRQRAEFMKTYLDQLRHELPPAAERHAS